MLTQIEILQKLPTATKAERRELLKLARELSNDPLAKFKNKIIQGDCLEVMKEIPDNSIDSLITDPPGGISFMQSGSKGKTWDSDKGGMLNWINWLSEIMSEAMRTMKPGACGLVWSIPRTSHWTGMALELAGFRIIDCVHHCFGSGFPKGQDISKHIDAIYKAEIKIVGTKKAGWHTNNRVNDDGWQGDNPGKREVFITAPTTPEAKQWDGWKTPALKPAVEGWWLVQKPISESSIARNILKHGVGGINIEACRIGCSEDMNARDFDDTNRKSPKFSGILNGGKEGDYRGREGHTPNGRYPANLILSCGADCEGDNHSPDCPVSVIGEQSGICHRRGNVNPSKRNGGEHYIFNRTGGGDCGVVHTRFDTGTAARYFKQLPFDPETVNSVYYQAKASTKDRTCNGTVENTHPTVKSTALMEYFIRLITPPNGIVLDPFGGSGTTGVAAKKIGFNYVLIEKEQEYIDIINKRLENA